MTMIICYAYTFIQGRSRERAQKEKQKWKKLQNRDSKFLYMHTYGYEGRR